MQKRGADLVRFYRLLGELEALNGGKHRLAGAGPDGPWPRRGVAFFFEKTEQRPDTGGGPRVVRVGTHALKAGLNTSLWERLAADQNGQHRQSPFRTLVGLGLRDLMGNTEPQSWGRGADAIAAARERKLPVAAVERQEATLESAVSLYIGQMPFVFIDVPDEPGPSSLRAFIEKNSIALLSNYARSPVDAPSAAWLGRRCGREKVPQSGLWNLQHVDAAYDPSFIDTMRSLMEDMRQVQEG
jgi:hypothetical protein